MNYIAEIKAFYDLVHAKQLSTGQIALWHALMYQNNKCAWIEWFTVPNITLELNSGLSRSGIYKARNILKQHGVIDFKANGTKATSYKLITLLNSNQSSNQMGVPMQDSNQVGKQDSNQGSNQGSKQDGNTLTKLNETKLDETKTSSADISLIASEFQQNGFGTINATVKDLLINLSEQYSIEWIIEAMKIAVKANARNIRYVEGILRKWNNSGGMKVVDDKSEKESPEENVYGW